ncbi:Uncharacterised protein [Mycobacteroides abscessus subsp. abscessus]|nr:Uncharacterised protein [Mycobacteroides abscessus subsp. abscessus]
MHVDNRLNLFTGTDTKQVDNWNPFCGSTVLRNFVTLAAINFTFVGEEEQDIMRGSRNQAFNEIVIMDVHPLNTATPAILCLEFTGCQSLDVAVMTQRDDHVFLLDQIFIFKTEHFTDQ